ncbi:phage tail fiber protein [Paraconexibacter algicola]|uniref:Uncharacterized protein n=1 Tax=Paraconexibacter algicola TaxID=2133960 RepID=A0A2T4UE17_9ACTN|nr:hypothetical protein [Paraconexibacter algicola]PTL55749.1 hypothetical protein C7Y72_19155 [Paraconexibacter algicola]
MTRPDGIRIPHLPQRRPSASGRRTHLFMAMHAVVEPDGSVAWQEDDWGVNALHDAGEQSMLNVYLREQANPTKFLALLNDATVAETDGTMSAVTEAKTPGSDGYSRQQILSTDWTDNGLVGGDYRFSAAEETFGPISGTAMTVTHSAICTTSTGAGLLLATLATSATTTVAVNQSFKVIFRWTQQ